MRIKLILVSTCIISSLSATNALASAGYYPTKIGDEIQIQGCISAKAKPPFVIYIVGDDDKKIEIKRYRNIPKVRSSCAKGQVEITNNWVVDRKGDYALYGRDLTSRKSYFLWPDGIESR